jgi:hypothetical protein
MSCERRFRPVVKIYNTKAQGNFWLHRCLYCLIFNKLHPVSLGQANLQGSCPVLPLPSHPCAHYPAQPCYASNGVCRFSGNISGGPLCAPACELQVLSP